MNTFLHKLFHNPVTEFAQHETTLFVLIVVFVILVLAGIGVLIYLSVKNGERLKHIESKFKPKVEIPHKSGSPFDFTKKKKD